MGEKARFRSASRNDISKTVITLRFPSEFTPYSLRGGNDTTENGGEPPPTFLSPPVTRRVIPVREPESYCFPPRPFPLLTREG